MKTRLIGVAVRVLRWLGRDLTSEQSVVEGKIREMVAQIVQMRQELETTRSRAQGMEQALMERQVRVVFEARIQDAAKREEVLKALKQTPEIVPLLDSLDQAWMEAVNAMTHPQMEDRQRQWWAGRAEALMLVKSWVQKG